MPHTRPIPRHQNNYPNYLKWLLILLGILTGGLILHAIFRSLSDRSNSNKALACQNYFQNTTYTRATPKVRTTLVGEIHGSNEQHVADCLESLIKPGDTLLIEYPSNGERIPCGVVHSEYKRFNAKAVCYGFDVPFDEARRLFGDYSFRANFLATKSENFFAGSHDGNVFVKRLKDFAEYLRSADVTPEIKIHDSDFNNRNGKYLRHLAVSLSGLSFNEIKAQLIKENNQLVEKANAYKQISRHGNTDHALTKEIIKHQEYKFFNAGDIFVVAGKDHIDPKTNPQIKEVFGGVQSVTVLSPK